MKTREILRQMKEDLKALRPDADTSATTTVVALARASVAVSRALAAGLEAEGLHISGFDVLLTLYRVGQPEGVALTKLSCLMAVTPASMTNRVDNLAERGLVERVICPNDRRSWWVRLTDDGRALIDRLLDTHMMREEQLMAGLSRPERKELRALLLKLLDHLETMPTEELRKAEAVV